MDFPFATSTPQGARPICHCLGVSGDEIQASIAEHDLTTVRGVTKSCGAGGGCTSCHRHIKQMLLEHAAQKRLAAPVPFAVEPLLGCA